MATYVKFSAGDVASDHSMELIYVVLGVGSGRRGPRRCYVLHCTSCPHLEGLSVLVEYELLRGDEIHCRA